VIQGRLTTRDQVPGQSGRSGGRAHRGKNIAVFADGTGNTTGRVDSNVLRLCRMADTSDRDRQLVIYDPGVGTCTTMAELRNALPETEARLFIDDPVRKQGWRARLLAEAIAGLAFGYGTRRNVLQLYRKLAEAYEPGDRIFLFGFSRGAFTVRALAGLIYRCGLLQPGHCSESRIDQAFELYRRHFEQAASAQALRRQKADVERFRRTYSHPCNIRFLGIFDTVKSVGYLWPTNLPHTRHNPIVESVRHALSLDERRSFYAPTTWGGLDGDTRPAVYVPACWGVEAGRRPAIRWQDVKEVWFAGCHSDVGGGYEARSPADVSIGWMLEEARAHGLLVGQQAGERLAGEVACEHLHDELKRRGTLTDFAWTCFWNLLQYVPRRDLNNEPPPPRASFRMRPDKRRVVEASLRGEYVAVHSSAKRCYSTIAPPWASADVRFVETSRPPARVPPLRTGSTP
jgi:uncharacterized protein (DUF2235 family)